MCADVISQRSPFIALREELLPVMGAHAGVRLTITDLLVMSCALARVEHLQAMAQFTPEGLNQGSDNTFANYCQH
jgi:hypothetical protein